jgi:ribosomal protein S18 acetylase RimI-like enzyme
MGCVLLMQIKNQLFIRDVKEGDEWAVFELFFALHQFNASLDARFALADGWEKVLQDHLRHVRTAGHGLTLIAWDDVTPVGLIMMDGHMDSPLFRNRRWAELLALYVVPSLHGAGIADELLRLGIVWARGRGYERVQLYVTASNVRAKRFYARQEFIPVQEIWRRELGHSDIEPPDDLTCLAAYEHGHDLLSVHPHHIVIDDPHEESR